MAVATPPYQQLTSQSWQAYQAQLATTQLQQPYGSALQQALAGAKDYLADRLRLALKARLPGLAPPDALAAIGAERGMPQGQTESSSAYATRLLNAWNLWPWAGTAYGLLQVFSATGYTNVIIAQVRGGLEFTLDGSGNLVTTAIPNGIFETDALSQYSPPRQSFWSKFTVIFPTPLPASWVSGGVPSSSSSEANFIRALIKAWSPAHATCSAIVIQGTGALWGVPATDLWGSGTWGAASPTVWTP